MHPSLTGRVTPWHTPSTMETHLDTWGPQPPARPMPAAAAVKSIETLVLGSCAGWLCSLADGVLGTARHRRIRVAQWLISASVYAGSATVLWFGVRDGWVAAGVFAAWVAFIALGQTLVYVAIRSGWSERYPDPALTAAQIMLGVVSVEWAYMMSGPMRTATLLPLLLIFAFGAFSLGWRRFVGLTLFALGTLLIAVAALNVARADSGGWSMGHVETRIDLVNVMMMAVLLPTISLLSARLSFLRTRLRQQRAELTEALAEVQRFATCDHLTGLANRRHMQERLVLEHARAQRGHTFSVVLIDLDHFKRINDSHGHARGDEALRAFADEAAAGLRNCDLLARWGGEEFLLLLPDTPAPQARSTVERLLARMHAAPPIPGLPMTFSGGVTEQQPGEAVAETVARADRAMYAAKQGGRDKVVLQ